MVLNVFQRKDKWNILRKGKGNLVVARVQVYGGAFSAFHWKNLIIDIFGYLLAACEAKHAFMMN